MAALRIAWILVALGALTPQAHAEDKAAARQAFIDGSKYYDLNQYAEALEAFKRAYWNYEDPVILYNIAQCHRALGHKKEAIEFYRSYLRKSPDARNRQDVEKIIAELNSAIDKEKTVATAPPAGTMATESKPASPPSPAKPAANGPQPPIASVVARPPPPARTDKPMRKRTWLWGVIGGVVVVGVAVGLGVGLGTQAHPPRADGQTAF